MKSPLPEAVKKSVLLSGLSEDMRDKLLKDSVRRTYSEGETIFMQGDTARAVFIVLSGFIKLSRMTPNGTEAVVTIMGRNRSFAEAMVLRGEPYPVTAEAITDSTLLQIDGVRLRQFLLENQEFAICDLEVDLVDRGTRGAGVDAAGLVKGDRCHCCFSFTGRYVPDDPL